MVLNLNFQDLQQIVRHGRVEKNGIILVVGRPLIPDLTVDASGTRGEVRFTVDETDPRLRSLQPRLPRLL